MNLHVAYHFKAGDRTGFGDLVIEGMTLGLRCNADIEDLKRRIRDMLAGDGHIGATVVILSWTEMWPAEGGTP